jgi:aerobic carbon-monoxide dehydrogenase small subunit
LTRYPEASEETSREWLQSNLCRCTGYEGISRSIEKAKNILNR